MRVGVFLIRPILAKSLALNHLLQIEQVSSKNGISDDDPLPFALSFSFADSLCFVDICCSATLLDLV